MTDRPQTVTAESLGIPAGSDNVWSGNFAERKLPGSSDGRGTVGGDAAATVARSIPPFKPQYCLCGNRLRPSQAVACSRSCASRRAARARHRQRPQTGAANPNYRGGLSTNGAHYARRFRADNPEIIRAQRIAYRAVLAGLLVRPDYCYSCFVACRPDAHHWDYSKPLHVQWLCGRCHVAADRVRRARAEAAEAK